MELLVAYLKCAKCLPTHDGTVIYVIGQLFSVQILNVHKNLGKQDNMFTTQYNVVDISSV